MISIDNKKKILFACFFVLAFFVFRVNTVSAKLIFDGSFKATDAWAGETKPYGNWTSALSCYSDETDTVPISSIGFGGRTSGYATKFTNKNGRTCQGGHHNQLSTKNSTSSPVVISLLGKPVTVPGYGLPFYVPDKFLAQNEYWIGWSQMIDPTWSMSSGWLMFGFADGNWKYNDYHTTTIDPAVNIGSHAHNQMGVLAFVMESTTNVRFEVRRNAIYKGEASYPGINPVIGQIGSGWFKKGIWYDFLVRIVFSASLSQNGKVELWGRENGGSYQMIYSNYNILTWDQHQGTTNPHEAYAWRTGIYTQPETGGTQSVYIASYKIGTTRMDVEYGSSLPAHCSNSVQDADETGIDCGGADCPNCVPAHCSNSVQDADETGIDCGGADCLGCEVPLPAHCSNSVQDADETGIDCGGADCVACPEPEPPPPCTPTLTCASYLGKCSANLSDGCTNTLDCSGSCLAPASCNTSSWMCEVPLTPPTVAPDLTVTTATKAVELRWTIPIGIISGYKVYKDGVLIATVTGIYFKDIPGDTASHIYQVSSYNTIGEGPKSLAVTQSAAIVPASVFEKKIGIDNFTQLIANTFRYTLSIIGGLALLTIMLGGMMYMGSTGTEQKAITAKKAITYAIAGLIIILLAYSISAIVERVFM